MDPTQKQIVDKQIMQLTQTIEKQVDQIIDRYDNLDVKDLDELRKNRLKEMKKLEAKKAEWLRNGHGQYEELAEEKLFFETIKKSDKVVVHFYEDQNERCLIMDKHLKALAAKHIETKFCKLNAHKCPYLTERLLRTKTLPTLVLVHDNTMVDRIVGFRQLGDKPDFTTEMLEWRIAQNGVIDYEGDLGAPPGTEKWKKSSGKKIRDGKYNKDDDDDLDVEEEGLEQHFEKVSSLDKIKQERQSTELTAEEAAELGLDE